MRSNRLFVFFAWFALSFLQCCRNKETMFQKLPASHTHIDFTNTLTEKPLFNILYYLYYYNGGGVAIGDINNDGLPDIYFTANSQGNNKLYLNKGNFEFEDITEKAGVAGLSDWCTGVTMADVNGDGLLDIYVCSVNGKNGLTGHNELYINNGNQTFSEKSKEYGLDFSGYTTQAAFFDFDNDGDLDCYVLNQSDHPHANITDTSRRRSYDPKAGDILYRNDLKTSGKFTDVSRLAGIYQSNLGYGLGIAIGDLNNDGWLDIYIGNDFHENDYYYLNNGNGSFTESGARVFNHYSRFSMGNDIADYNNDGQLDLVTVDMLPDNEKVLKTYGSDENPDIYQFKIINNGYQYQYSRNCLQQNNGDGTSFSERALINGVSATDWSWSPLFADFDNDGNKDLFISSGIVKRPVDLDYVKFISDLDMRKGRQMTDKYDAEAINSMPDGSSHPYLFRNIPGKGFKDLSDDWGTGKLSGYFNGAAYADLDNDGNLDLVVNCINAPAVILKNNAPKKNYLTVSLHGEGMNSFGIGARVYLFQKDSMQYEQLMLSRGFESSSEPRLHFGLGNSATADSLLVVWPDRRFQVITQVRANQVLTLDQKNAAGNFNQSARFPPPKQYFTESNIALPWQHKEDPFVDFNVQYLIPHAESTRGPKIAVADVNGDGLDDFYACGAKDQPGALMVQQSNGSFTSVDAAVFASDAASEDVDAKFFDANGDGHPDLYVVSGGNEYSGNVLPLLDRLYINDGKGNFTRSPDGLPAIYANKSCVAIADIDGDGDQDIFCGNLANPNAYGLPQTSYLLLNDGKAHFTLAPQDQMPLRDLGMVTSASFSDLDHNGFPDLVVAGEWMPLTIFMNHKGRFVKSVVPKSTGWWQTVFLDDVNGDGNPDLLAGNWGWNNKFWSGKNGPVKLYVRDFDHNGQTDQLLSYTSNGEEYPFLAKDEVERALPVLRKHYLLYSEYAGLPMKDAFYGFVDTMQPLQAERLGSVIGYGDGKGNFDLHDLPPDLQLAPIFSFAKAPPEEGRERQYVCGGNFFDVIPYEGRYDAQALALFNISPQGRIKVLPQRNFEAIKDQVRDIQWIRTKKGKLMAVARNNKPILWYQPDN